MAKYTLSRKAEADLAAIIDFSLETFGIEQARIYYDSLIDALERFPIILYHIRMHGSNFRPLLV